MSKEWPKLSPSLARGRAIGPILELQGPCSIGRPAPPFFEGKPATTHPRPSDLKSFLRGEIRGFGATRLVAHLLRGCEVCLGEIQPIVSLIFSREPLAARPFKKRSRERKRVS